MTANAGKDANGKSGQRPTGADAEGGRTRKKTSAAKPPSDEVTVKTNAADDTNGSAKDPDETVVDIPAKDDYDTVQDVAPADEAPSADEDDDDDATAVDAFDSTSSSFSSPSLESSESFESSGSSDVEESSSRTASFGLPKDLGSAGFGEPENDGSGAEKWASEPAPRDDDANYPYEIGESMPSSGRSAAMDSSTPSSRALGGGAASGGTPASYAPGGLGAPSDPAGPSGSGSSGGRPAIESAAARVSKLTGSLRKPDKSGGRKAPRKAHLQVARFEPWSVMKFSFIMSLVCFLVLFVAVAVLYVILSWLGVFDALSNTIHDLTSNDQGKTGGLNPASWFSAARILGYTALIGTLNVLLITALATVWSVIYNMAADLVGGVEVTLKEADS
ncbi:hypothetical protein GCM10027176_48250 [Actinoallomurus bryophytorum]|uniref:Transmembrane protein DUF3566 n=1 Tax=Actinoallomurus bryophytorum TaxID=1490222 RepID=A0A543CKC3_9ACTN|nr:transmembrane protein DUF3566 [Actinoallomurus bryophytorum]